MTDQMKPGRHPFLEDLAADVVLTTNVLKRPVAGRDKVLRGWRRDLFVAEADLS
jgi:hypothetical protein